MKQQINQFALFLFTILISISCTNEQKESGDTDQPANWAEKLGFPKGKKVIILHADDAGMCEEANIATFQQLETDVIQSAAGMPPCPKFEEFIDWAKSHPEEDLGLHLTLTSEWKTYRWHSVEDTAEVPGLIDPERKLWREVPDVVRHASAKEVEKEIRAQIEKSIALGYRPDHIDTHMGTLYAHPEYIEVFFRVAEEYKIPANVIDLSDSAVVEKFRAVGYPINDDVIRYAENYSLPKIDNFTSAPNAKTYEEKIQKFKDLILSLKPGITEIIFHPSVETENLKTITNSWQQRVWEAKMFSDPDLIKFFEQEGILFTNWKEIMERFK
ncbi:polysaccharide deacetylase family protein [Flexithrix dorotheae]|uniref:polysaccharide deacetylase family protein n=1 Tax=Flexithrix dorotheae TaxID=70993 RepID=UPI00035D5828|nr:polysaccharide deacetylase family protein [Flexithrix dorotheae]